MTYRKLHRLLLVMATLMAVTLWWISCSTCVRAEYGPAATKQGSIVAMIHTGSVFVHYFPEAVDGTGFRFSHGPVSGPDRGLLGAYRKIWIPGFLHEVEFPIWFPWILFIGATFPLYHFIERRSARRKEQELATHAADADPP